MNHPLQFVLLADFSTVVSILVGLVALAGWVVRQIMEANQKGGPPARGGPPQAAGRGGVQMAGQQADPLRNQVEEFLRRAGRAPQGNQPGAPQRPQPVSEIEVLLDDDVSLTEARPMAAAAAADMPQPIVPPQAPADKSAKRPPRRPIAPPRRVTLAERAAEREVTRTRKSTAKAAQLGQRIIEDDYQFDVQLKAKFDHKVGTLGGGVAAGVVAAAAAADQLAASETPAAQIATMLANPDGVRQAIILNEILNRPSDRW